MPTEPSKQTSFSPGRRWKIGFDLFARTLLVLAVAVMVNFIGAQFFQRYYLSSRTSVRLSTQTLSVLHALTNHVAVTLYYSRGDDFYPDVVALMKEYNKANPRITYRTVDPVRDAGEAEKVKLQYGLDTTGDKNLIIFDAGNGRVQIRPGDALIQHAPTGMSEDKKIIFGPVAFRGEEMFTSMVLALEDPKPLKAYFLQGDGESSPADPGNYGYSKFAAILAQNDVAAMPLDLQGANDVPADCNLLVISAPTTRLNEQNLRKIDRYLTQGGRLLVMFNYASVGQPTGLEPILQRWGVNVGADYVKDSKNSGTGGVVSVNKYAEHPVVDALAGNNLALQMVLPRPVSKVELRNPPADAPQVTELAFSGPGSVLSDDPAATPRSYPLMAAVEQKNSANIGSPRDAARLLVIGDSLFLSNFPIDYGGNRDFAALAINWLMDRAGLVEGIGPQPVSEFRLLMTQSQQSEVRWLLLGALPGAVLLLGGLVWLVRRK